MTGNKIAWKTGLAKQSDFLDDTKHLVDKRQNTEAKNFLQCLI